MCAVVTGVPFRDRSEMKKLKLQRRSYGKAKGAIALGVMLSNCQNNFYLRQEVLLVCACVCVCVRACVRVCVCVCYLVKTIKKLNKESNTFLLWYARK